MNLEMTDRTFAQLKHTNACVRPEALHLMHGMLHWKQIRFLHLYPDMHHTIDLDAATAIDKIFYEVIDCAGFYRRCQKPSYGKTKRHPVATEIL